MAKRFILMLVLLSALCLLSGCASSANPLLAAEATDAPGLNMRLHAAKANELSADSIEATLYFRYLDEPMLASETRVLTVGRDETVEKAIVRALIEGPSAGRSDLRRLFPEDLVVESTVSRDSILFITFNSTLQRTGDIPQNWQDDPAWQIEAPLRRYLAMMSIVNSITESYSYTGIQVLMHDTGDARTSMRLENSFYLGGTEGLSDMLMRDESCLLTPKNALELLLGAWLEKNYERMALYLTDSEDGAEKPAYAQLLETIQSGASLTAYQTGQGTVSLRGSRAVVAAQMTLRKQSGEELRFTGYPMRLMNVGGIWMLPMNELMRLVQQ